MNRKQSERLPSNLGPGASRFNRTAAQQEELLNEGSIQGPDQPDDLFDEEKEQAMLEEARKKKERGKKMREAQEKMLADMRAKKEAKEKQENDKKIKYEKQLKAAREQVKANYELVDKES